MTKFKFSIPKDSIKWTLDTLNIEEMDIQHKINYVTKMNDVAYACAIHREKSMVDLKKDIIKQFKKRLGRRKIVL